MLKKWGLDFLGEINDYMGKMTELLVNIFRKVRVKKICTEIVANILK